jgi:hypothetical protein
MSIEKINDVLKFFELSLFYCVVMVEEEVIKLLTW